MTREVDRRDFSVNKVTDDREAELHALASEVSERLPGQHALRIASFDSTTGNPAAVVSESPSVDEGSYVARALDHVQRIGTVLGLAATQPPEYVADSTVQRTSSSAAAVHLQQCYKGIPIFQAAQAVRFAPDGTIEGTAGSTVSVTGDPAIAPQLPVEDAVRRAAEHVAAPDADEQDATDEFDQPLDLPTVDVTEFIPAVLATFPDRPERPTVLAAGPFGADIKANLIWFPLRDDLWLGWETILTMPEGGGQYDVIVDADTGDVLYSHQLLQSVAARANVFRVDGGGQRQLTEMPRPLVDYGLPFPDDLPPGMPDTWVEADSTVGNSVRAHQGDDGPPVTGLVKDGVVTFNPADSRSSEQRVINLFYFNCVMHDFFYLLGFVEATGNFQQDDLGRGGAPSDRVDARSHAGPVVGTANMFTPVDGLSPVMNMGLVQSTRRHTALDATVVFHEFTHGVTNRLVGGPLNVHALDAPQSGGMGEGWGDWTACLVTNKLVVGSWVVDRPGGIRGFPYDANFPDNFGDLGQGRYTKVHSIGEIWCATLLEMCRTIGSALGALLVVDALKLSPANPSFLDMRDAIFVALDHKLAAGQLGAAAHASAFRGIWTVFSRFGMGPNAESLGASLFGVRPDFALPALPDLAPPEVRVEVAPALPIPDAQRQGVTSVLWVPQTGQIVQMTVSLEVEHPFVGDLHVSLTGPDGTTAVLHDRTGGSNDDLLESYSTEETTALAAFVGSEGHGEWTLRVADLEGLDVGKLRRWGLEIDLEEGRTTAASAIADAHAGAPSETDDLTLIKGIGPVIGHSLIEAGISTFEQLAACSPDELVARLGEASKLTADRIAKQGWIEEARQLASERAAPAPLTAGPVSTPERQHYATFMVELLLDEQNEVRRTRVVHIQEQNGTGRGENAWAGWEGGNLLGYFVEHAALRDETASLATEDLALDVEAAFEEVSDDRGAREHSGRIEAEVTFQLSGPAADRVASDRAQYFVHVLAYDQVTGQSIVLAGSQARLHPGTLVYREAVEFAVPEVGRYQLLGTVLLSAYDSLGVTVGPRLKVVA